MDDEGWYDLETRERKNFEGISIVGAMNLRIEPSPRLLQHFLIFYADSFKKESLNIIYLQIFGQHLDRTCSASSYFEQLQRWDIPLINGLVELYTQF